MTATATESRDILKVFSVFYTGLRVLPGDPSESRALPESNEAEPPGDPFPGRAWKRDEKYKMYNRQNKCRLNEYGLNQGGLK